MELESHKEIIIDNLRTKIIIKHHGFLKKEQEIIERVTLSNKKTHYEMELLGKRYLINPNQITYKQIYKLYQIDIINVKEGPNDKKLFDVTIIIINEIFDKEKMKDKFIKILGGNLSYGK